MVRVGVFKIHYECFGAVSNPLSSRTSTLFLHSNLRKLIISLMDHFVCPAIMESISFSKKLMMIDLSNKENLLLDESIDLGFGTTKSTQKGGSKCYGKVDQKA